MTVIPSDSNRESYIVDIRHAGIDRSPDLPETVTIRAEETVTLDISIDTGKR